MTASPALTTTVPRTRPGRTAGAAVFVAAAAFAAEGLLALTHPTGDHHWDALSEVLNGAYALASVAAIVALPTVGRWLQVGRIGRAGIVVAQVGFAAMVVESVVSGLADGSTLGAVFFGGLLVCLLGLLVVGISALVAGGHRWAALLPVLGMVVGIVGGDHGGSIVTGVTWAILGLVLLRGE